MKDFFKKEFQNWKTYEIIIFVFSLIIIIINSLFLKDKFISILYAICGITYTLIAGKGKISCYIFGIVATLCYSYLTFTNKIYAQSCLNLFYYLPMQLYGIYSWHRYLNKKNNEIIKTYLTNKQPLILSIFFIIIWFLIYKLLMINNGTHIILDSLITSLSILGMYLTVKRCIEQWLVWSGVNLLCVYLWLSMLSNGIKSYSTLLVWLVYFVLGIYFYFQWKKELKD